MGETCLETILRGSFADRKTILKRRNEVIARIERTYGSLVVDPGAWISWIVQHVPTRLDHLAAQLRRLGTVLTDGDLNRLIEFHDGNRLFPRAALVPDLDSIIGTTSLPSHITINDAKQFLKGLTPDGWERLVSLRSKAYQKANIDELLDRDGDTRGAWRRLNRLGKRAVVALAKLSDDLSHLAPRDLSVLTTGLLPAKTPIAVPSFAWRPEAGLAIVESLSDEVGDEARVWLWMVDGFRDVDVSVWRSVIPVSVHALLDVEVAAFWGQPCWYNGRRPGRRRKSDLSAGQKTRAAPKRGSKQAKDETSTLQTFPCFRTLLQIAKFRTGKPTFLGQLAWLKQQLARQRFDWEDFIWNVERYATNPDCRDRIDRLSRSL